MDLETDPRNQFDLANHGGRHTNDYLDEVQARLDAGYANVAGQGQEAADAELGRIMAGIKQDVLSGKLRPYASKEVGQP